MSTGPVCGTQMYVFHQHFSKNGQKLDEHLDEALADVAGAGIEYVEAMLTLVESEGSAKDFVSLLDKHSVKLCSLYGAAEGGVFHVADTAEKAVAGTLELAEKAKQIGCPSLSLNPAPKPEHAAKTEDELKVQAEYLNKLGEGLAKLDMGLGLHNHTPAGLNNAREIRYNCDHTDPKFVGLCLDTHWVHRAGADPFELLDTYPDRITSLHIRNSKDGVWMEDFGEGDLDYRKLADWVKKNGFSGPLVIELAYEKDTQITRSLRENLTRSREYVREVFGV